MRGDGSSRPRSSRRFRQSLLLAGILAASAWLRFSGLEQRGLLFFDEGVYHLETRFHAGWIRAWRAGQAGWRAGGRQEAAAYLNDPARWEGHPPWCGKPGWTFLGSLFGGLGTSRPENLLLLSAAAGVISVGLTCVLGNLLFGPGVGLLGAALLAFSAGHIQYSRAAFPESVAVMAFLLFLWFFVISRTHPRQTLRGAAAVLGGAAAAWAFLASRRLPFLPVVAMALELIPWPGRPGGRPSLRRMSWWLIGWCMTLLAVEFFTRRVDALSLAKIPTYFEQLAGLTQAYVFTGKLIGGLRWGGWAAYPYYWLRLEGAAIFGLVLVGFFCLLGRNGPAGQPAWPAGRTTAAAILLIWGFFSLFCQSLARNLAVVWPLLMLAAALAVKAGWDRLRRIRPLVRGGLAILCAWAILATQVPRALAAQRMRTGYREAIRWISDREGKPPGELVFLSTQPAIFQALTGSRRIGRPIVSDETLPLLLGLGVHYLVMDYQAVLGGIFAEPMFIRVFEDFSRWLEARAEPAVSIPHAAGACLWVEFEHNMGGMGELWRRLNDPARRARMGVIEIYDLREIARLRREEGAEK